MLTTPCQKTGLILIEKYILKLGPFKKLSIPHRWGLISMLPTRIAFCSSAGSPSMIVRGPKYCIVLAKKDARRELSDSTLLPISAFLAYILCPGTTVAKNWWGFHQVLIQWSKFISTHPWDQATMPPTKLWEHTCRQVWSDLSLCFTRCVLIQSAYALRQRQSRKPTCLTKSACVSRVYRSACGQGEKLQYLGKVLTLRWWRSERPTSSARNMHSDSTWRFPWRWLWQPRTRKESP